MPTCSRTLCFRAVSDKMSNAGEGTSMAESKYLANHWRPTRDQHRTSETKGGVKITSRLPCANRGIESISPRISGQESFTTHTRNRSCYPNRSSCIGTVYLRKHHEVGTSRCGFRRKLTQLLEALFEIEGNGSSLDGCDFDNWTSGCHGQV